MVAAEEPSSESSWLWLPFLPSLSLYSVGTLGLSAPSGGPTVNIMIAPAPGAGTRPGSSAWWLDRMSPLMKKPRRALLGLFAVLPLPFSSVPLRGLGWNVSASESLFSPSLPTAASINLTSFQTDRRPPIARPQFEPVGVAIALLTILGGVVVAFGWAPF